MRKLREWILRISGLFNKHQQVIEALQVKNSERAEELLNENWRRGMELHSQEALAPVFADLNKYDATTHFIG